MSFDLSLARGLDYYTGIIYEAVTEGSAPPQSISATPSLVQPKPSKSATADNDGGEIDESSVGVGSIAAGGRYDDLVGMFSGEQGAAGKIPCVGISFGVERLFSLLLQKEKEKGLESAGRGKSTQVFVMSLGDGMLEERMEICKDLWAAGIKTEFMYKKKPKAPAQFGYVDKEKIPFAVTVSPDEWSQQQIRIKPQIGKEEGSGHGILLQRNELINWLKQELAKR